MQSRFFMDLVTVLHRSSSRGTGGQTVYTYSTFTDILGSLQNGSGQHNVSMDIDAYRKTKMFYCNPTTNVLDGDRIRFELKDYDVIHSPTIFNHHMEIMLQYKGST
jgi:hypothetical protein